MKFRKRNLISTGWYLTASIFGLGFIASIPGYYARFIQLPLQQHLGLGIVLISSVSGLVSLLTAATSLALAALLFFRKPDDRMAIFVSYFLLGYGVIMAGPLELLEYLLFGKTGAISLYAQYALITTPIFALLLLFPSGKFVPPQSRWILFISLLSILVLPWMNYEELYYLNTMRSQAVTIILTVLALIAFCSQIYRYLKKSTLIERQQTKVVVYGFGMWFFFMLISAPLYYLIIHSPQSNLSQAWQNASSIFWQLGLATIPISLTIAILRSHLWDVDVIIRRTLIYSLLTAVLGSLYLGSVILLQAIFSALGSQQQPVVIVLSTLAIIVLIAPVRRRIQDFIDRRFYRRRYDAEHTLAVFSLELRDKVDLEQLSNRVMELVQDTIQPESVSLWLKPPQQRDI